MKIEYKGYTISQAKNNHVMITKDNEAVFHSSMTKKLNEEELKQQIDFYLLLIDKIGDD